MKILFTAICVLFLSAQSYANNFERFAGNYNPLGGVGRCGLHVEFNGNTMLLSMIVPPSQNAELVCRKYGTECDGKTYALECNEDRCFDPKDINNAFLDLVLLSNGNIFFEALKWSFIRTSNTKIDWCVPL